MPLPKSSSPLFTPCFNEDSLPEPYCGPSLTEYTEGDLHANLMRLIESLRYFGVIEITKEHYAELLTCYRRALNNKDDQANNLKIIDLIRTTIKVKNKELLARLIGDVVADRTGNDVFTLVLVDKLVQADANLRIVMSNHDSNFIFAIHGAQSIDEVINRVSEQAGFFEAGAGNQGDSFKALIASVQRGELTFDELKRLTHSYLSTLILLDYSVDEETKRFTIYSHAPINRGMLSHLAAQWGLKYPGDDCSHLEMKEFIDSVNLSFRSLLQYGNAKLIKHLFDCNDASAGSNLIWTRESNPNFIFDAIDKISKDGFQYHYTYGHDHSVRRRPSHYRSLDQSQGKGDLRIRFRAWTSVGSWARPSNVPEPAPDAPGIASNLRKAVALALPGILKEELIADYKPTSNRSERQRDNLRRLNDFYEEQIQQTLRRLHFRLQDLNEARELLSSSNPKVEELTAVQDKVKQLQAEIERLAERIIEHIVYRNNPPDSKSPEALESETGEALASIMSDYVTIYGDEYVAHESEDQKDLSNTTPLFRFRTQKQTLRFELQRAVAEILYPEQHDSSFSNYPKIKPIPLKKLLKTTRPTPMSMTLVDIAERIVNTPEIASYLGKYFTKDELSKEHVLGLISGDPIILNITGLSPQSKAKDDESPKTSWPKGEARPKTTKASTSPNLLKLVNQLSNNILGKSRSIRWTHADKKTSKIIMLDNIAKYLKSPECKNWLAINLENELKLLALIKAVCMEVRLFNLFQSPASVYEFNNLTKRMVTKAGPCSNISGFQLSKSQRKSLGARAIDNGAMQKILDAIPSEAFKQNTPS